MVRRMVEYPNLESVQVIFGEECVADEDDEWANLSETETHRQETMELCFGAMAAVNAQPGKDIRKLTVENLQNVVRGEVLSSKEFEGVISGLEELHILVRSADEQNAHMDIIFEYETFWTLWTRFNKTWLTLAKHISSLTLYSSHEWGTASVG